MPPQNTEYRRVKNGKEFLRHTNTHKSNDFVPKNAMKLNEKKGGKWKRKKNVILTWFPLSIESEGNDDWKIMKISTTFFAAIYSAPTISHSGGESNDFLLFRPSVSPNTRKTSNKSDLANDKDKYERKIYRTIIVLRFFRVLQLYFPRIPAITISS